MKFLFLFLLGIAGCSSISSKSYVNGTVENQKRTGFLQNIFGDKETSASVQKSKPQKPVLESRIETGKTDKTVSYKGQDYFVTEQVDKEDKTQEKSVSFLQEKEKAEAIEQSQKATEDSKAASKKGILPTADNYQKHTVQVFVTVLQHPVKRDLATCDVDDVPCIQYYEKNGYLKIQDKPNFTGKDDMPQNEGYPTRKWRPENRIPRF
jgi:hypothetical protein